MNDLQNRLAKAMKKLKKQRRMRKNHKKISKSTLRKMEIIIAADEILDKLEESSIKTRMRKAG